MPSLEGSEFSIFWLSGACRIHIRQNSLHVKQVFAKMANFFNQIYMMVDAAARTGMAAAAGYEIKHQALGLIRDKKMRSNNSKQNV